MGGRAPPCPPLLPPHTHSPFRSTAPPSIAHCSEAPSRGQTLAAWPPRRSHRARPRAPRGGAPHPLPTAAATACHTRKEGIMQDGVSPSAAAPSEVGSRLLLNSEVLEGGLTKAGGGRGSDDDGRQGGTCRAARRYGRRSEASVTGRTRQSDGRKLHARPILLAAMPTKQSRRRHVRELCSKTVMSQSRVQRPPCLRAVFKGRHVSEPYSKANPEGRRYVQTLPQGRISRPYLNAYMW
eukprot:364797-Chlamydomonas_euryale.AAC.4